MQLKQHATTTLVMELSHHMLQQAFNFVFFLGTTSKGERLLLGVILQLISSSRKTDSSALLVMQ